MSAQPMSSTKKMTILGRRGLAISAAMAAETRTGNIAKNEIALSIRVFIVLSVHGSQIGSICHHKLRSACHVPHVPAELAFPSSDASANDSSLSHSTTLVAVTPLPSRSFGQTSRSKYVAMFSDVGL